MQVLVHFIVFNYTEHLEREGLGKLITRAKYSLGRPSLGERYTDKALSGPIRKS